MLAVVERYAPLPRGLSGLRGARSSSRRVSVLARALGPRGCAARPCAAGATTGEGGRQT